MTATSPITPARHAPALRGQTVLVIGGSAGIGLETARAAREAGADLILTARDPDRLQQAGRALGAGATAAFDATDFARLARFFDELPAPVDHVLVTGPGPYYAPLAELDLAKARRDVESHLLLPIEVARHAPGKVRLGGTLLFMGGTGGRRTAPGFALIGALTAALPALTKNLALELAPIRVNLIAAGFVDTPLSAAILGDQLEVRREQLRTTLPIRRVVGPADIAALAMELITNTALTGATFDIDGGQQLVEEVTLMQGVELVVILLAVSAALRLLARRLRVPHPVLLVLAGLALVFVPGLPRVEFEPETLFLVFVPPLLYWGALTTSLRDFRTHFWPIARYGTLVVLRTLRTHPLGTLLLYAAVVTGTVIGVRLVYTFIAGAVLRRTRRARQGQGGNPEWRQVAFLGWAGMRGGDSLVLALAVPVAIGPGDPFPARGLIIFLTFSVILATLVLQGLTLAPLIRWWGLTEGGQRDTEEAHARRVVAEAGLRRLRVEAGREGAGRATARSLEATYRRRVERWSARDRARHGREDDDHARLAGIDGSRAENLASAYRALRVAMIEDEREALERLRDQGVIGDDVLRRVQRDLDLESVLLESAEDGAPPSPYELD